MKLERKLALDTIGGGTALLLLKPLVILLGWLMRRDHQTTVGKSLCFIKPLGGGSLTIAFPMLLGLRRQFPDTRFALITTPAVRPFAEALGVFDEILIVDDSRLAKLLPSAFSAWRRAFLSDTVVDLEVHSRLTTVFSLLTCARNRIGFYLHSTVWKRKILTHLVFYNNFSGSYFFYNHVAGTLGTPPASIEDCRSALLTHLGLSPRPASPVTDPSSCVVAFGHSCSDLGRERMLSPEQWAEALSRRFAPDSVFCAEFFGGPRDRSSAEAIIVRLQTAFPAATFRNLCGEFPLRGSLARLHSAHEFIGIDSALVHFARLFGLKTTSYWGPTDPATRLAPVRGLEEEIHYRKISCSPCIHVADRPPCLGKNACIGQQFADHPRDDNPRWVIH